VKDATDIFRVKDRAFSFSLSTISDEKKKARKNATCDLRRIKLEGEIGVPHIASRWLGAGRFRHTKRSRFLMSIADVLRIEMNCQNPSPKPKLTILDDR
jgi:hypothetical protein